MIDVAIKFLVGQLDAYLKAREGSPVGSVVVSPIVNETGSPVIENAIGVALLNIEEERTTRQQLPESRLINGQRVVLEPKLQVNLLLLFAARFGDYPTALKYLSHVLTFFQAHPRFSSEESPALDEAIALLVPELQSLSYEQLNQVWASIGAKMLPSVVYKVRLVRLQDVEPTAVSPPITEISSTASVS